VVHRVQIQILLHFFLLQYPRPPTDENTAKKKRKKSNQKERLSTYIPLEDRLESMMDKLAVWQLLSSIDKEQDRKNQTKGKGRVDDDRDWMQRFCQDIVQPT
jgi:DNA replication regulator SLD3